MKYFLSFLIAGLIAGGVPAQAQSEYGCHDLAGLNHMASVEGAEGTFYRVLPDLQMSHAMTPDEVDALARLSEALAAQGTTLVYVPVPTKSLAMPEALPMAAKDHGFDVELATTIYDDTLRRLESRGIRAVNVRRALREVGAPMFRTDHRWTAEGARRTAEAVGAALTDLDLGEVDGSFASTSLGIQSIPSAARGKLQRHCRVTLPEVETEAWATSGLRSPLVQGGVSGPKAPSIVVVGTEFTALEPANFSGFLAEVTGREVAHHAVPEGGSFAAISSYLTSRGFRETPPQILVWENPIQNRLGQRGPQPMEELIAAAQDNCRVWNLLFLGVAGWGSCWMGEL
ncbi:MAG: hypothetical protein AAFV27_12605, partial [Pseudomonadota bacterium]